MKQTYFLRGLVVAVMLVVANVTTYAGTDILPMGQYSSRAWEAKYYYALNSGEQAPVNWYEYSFDDSEWGTIQGPLALNGRLAYMATTWEAVNATYWTRRHFNLNEIPTNGEQLVFCAIHDDKCMAYLNGVQIYNGTGAITDPTFVTLPDAAWEALKIGDNVLAVYVRDEGSFAHMDYGLYFVDDLKDAVVRGDVPFTVSTNETGKWKMEGKTAMVRGDGTTTRNTSWLTMTYNADVQTEFSFWWACYNSSNHSMQLYIDGVQQNNTTNGNYTAQRYYLPAGEHVVAFRDTIGGSATTGNWSGIKNIKIKKIASLETAALSTNSAPLTFVNNSATPWTPEGECVEHTNWWASNKGSTLSSSFTVNKTSKFSFKRRSFCKDDTYYNREGWHELIYSVNGIQINRAWGLPEFAEHCMVLEPGEYTVQWRDTVFARGEIYFSQIKDVELSDNWQTVELATVGTLGYEALSLPAYEVLTDVEMLKVVGPMNAADWTDIKNMTNLKALDLSEAVISEIPNNAFDGKSWINSVIMPEGIKTIGEYAFRGTNLRRINIPSTVTNIKRNAFYGTPLQYVTFTNGSQLEEIACYAFQTCKSLQEAILPEGLKTIGYAAFEQCTALKRVVMPNTVTTLGAYAFSGCTSLQSIRFSDGMTEVPDFACYNCTALNDVHLPSGVTLISREAFRGTTSLSEIDFPASLRTIVYLAFYGSGLESVKLPINLQYLGTETFANCSKLKYIEMPSYIERGTYSFTYYYNNENDRRWTSQNSGYRSNFNNCPAIETIVMRSATPPAIDADPLANSRAKSDITLVVPSFSVVNYRLDSYWYQFGSIVEGDDVDYWKITSPLMLTNNRRMNGTPDVDLYYDGQLTVGGSAPMTMGQFNYWVSETNPARLLNTCNAVSATTATSKFYAEANKWYFFTPLHDVTVADITLSNDASFVFRYYDAQNRAVNGASGSWKNIDTDKLLAGQGYIFHCNKACVITFPMDAEGQAQLFRTADITRALTANEAATTANRSWNYIGNPYPTYYDIYYMDFSAPITVWTGNTYKAYSVGDDDFVLRPMQSFFVQKPDAVDDIVFRKEGRQLSSVIERAASVKGQYAPAKADRHIFNLRIESPEGQADETRVVVNPAATAAYDLSCDAAKFMSFDASVPQLLTLDDEGTSYAINERPLADGRVMLAYYAGQAGTYTISALRADGTIELRDNAANLTVDLTQGAYSFSSDATSGIDGSRFTLLLSNMATGIENNSEITIHNSNVTTYDLSGRRVNDAKLPKGIYIRDGRKVVK